MGRTKRCRTMVLGAGVAATMGAIGAAACPAADATSAAEAIGYLNEQRAAAGIPTVTEDATLSGGCALQVAYMEANPGQSDMHVEEPGKPGYTELGAEAGSRSDLWSGRGVTAASEWSATENPWMSATDYAPLHAAKLFDPAATQAWYAEDEHNACLGVNAGTDEGGHYPSTPTLYSYPGDGQGDVPFAVEASELPTTPAEVVGLHGVTGPNLVYYLLDSTDTYRSEPTVLNYSLTGPGGAVEARVVTPQTPVTGWGETVPFSDYDEGCAIAVPVAPLAPNTTYTATLEWEAPDDGGTLTQEATFTTGDERVPSPRPKPKPEPEPEPTAPEGTAAHAGKHAPARTALRVRRVRRGLRVTSTSPAPISYTVKRLPSGRVVGRGRVAHGATWDPRLRRGRYLACLAQPADAAHTSARDCLVLGGTPASRANHAASRAHRSAAPGLSALTRSTRWTEPWTPC